MQEQITPQKMKVTIEEVNKQNNEVYINDGNGNEGWFPISAPANINYCRVGEAEITMKNNFITYCRNSQNTQNKGNFNQNRGNFNNYPKKEFKPFNQSNPIQKAEDYQPEEKESKRIGMTKEIINASLEEIRLMYNSLSFTGKWIVATNIFPRQDKPGKYDCMFFISEKREGFEPGEYLTVKDKDIDNIEENKPSIKETNMGVM